MAKNLNVIRIPKGSAEDICKALGIGRTTLYQALNFTSNSDSAKQTRDVVMAKYGGVMSKRTVWNM